MDILIGHKMVKRKSKQQSGSLGTVTYSDYPFNHVANPQFDLLTAKQVLVLYSKVSFNDAPCFIPHALCLPQSGSCQMMIWDLTNPNERKVFTAANFHTHIQQTLNGMKTAYAHTPGDIRPIPSGFFDQRAILYYRSDKLLSSDDIAHM